MEQTNILERAAPADEQLELASSETEYALNVVLIYQDAPTRKWATQVCDHVSRLTGDDAVRCTRWDVSRLSDPKVFKQAVLTAVQADVILISIYDADELPVDLCVWIDAWLPRRSLPTGAMIALISVPGQAGAQSDQARRYLRAVARKGQLDFLLRERKLPATLRGYFYVEKLTERTNPTTSLVQNALSRDHENLSSPGDPS